MNAGDLTLVHHSFLGRWTDICRLGSSTASSSAPITSSSTTTGTLNELLHKLFCLLKFFRIQRRNLYTPILLHIHINKLKVFNNGTYLFPSRSNHLSNRIGRNLERTNARNGGRQLFPRSCEDFIHLIQNVHPSHLCLLEGAAHGLNRQSLAFDIELKGRDTRSITRDLEVHRSESVLSSEDVGDDDCIIVGDGMCVIEEHTHGYARYGALDGYPGVHECEASSADGCHGG
mmetsp:Transcript_17908/g.26169  ORF Transcript_17908/g.26169 Transcript_17908/m.26169 type:complete len:231 (+) Transcript_17908:400-1092(+)